MSVSVCRNGELERTVDLSEVVDVCVRGWVVETLIDFCSIATVLSAVELRYSVRRKLKNGPMPEIEICCGLRWFLEAVNSNCIQWQTTNVTSAGCESNILQDRQHLYKQHYRQERPTGQATFIDAVRPATFIDTVLHAGTSYRTGNTSRYSTTRRRVLQERQHLQMHYYMQDGPTRRETFLDTLLHAVMSSRTGNIYRYGTTGRDVQQDRQHL